MKLYIEDDNGNRTELEELSEATATSDVLIFKLNNQLSMKDMEVITERLNKATRKQCILLDNKFDKVYGMKY